MTKITVVGGGLAGSESAYYLANKGYKVTLIDIKPKKMTPAHHNENFGELVCSNSLKSNDYLGNACGLLKEELRRLGSMVIKVADSACVPAGNALSVNRELFAERITKNLKEHENIEIVCAEYDEIDKDAPTIIATGPLTTPKLIEELQKYTGIGDTYFFDSSAPIVSFESIDMESAFFGDRYGKGNGDHVNCPMEKDEYLTFVSELLGAKRAKLKDFENDKVFEGCMPIEIMASRGIDTLRYGPFKPVGLIDERTGKRSYACLQLRREDKDGKMYNLIGCQTNLTFGEQERVFRLIPALKNAEFYRYGVMHKNVFVNAPKCLNKDFSLKAHDKIFIAGQLSGVEGYVESIASGLVSAISLDRKLQNKESVEFSADTVIGALCNYISTENVDFQPMNANYGILNGFDELIKDKKLKREKYAKKSLEQIKRITEIL